MVTLVTMSLRAGLVVSRERGQVGEVRALYIVSSWHGKRQKSR